ncbi:hypothetical protein NPX13_g4123 [Xylaria arbuscula]|uniref:Heterokaryon incompatibility domain-containing protein n=1 Tax=Xylaria arbuscula TaxID=114810 RepID=A0A9W8TM75_9PEZI|nr:hypothetical protein NPX13_g4123 [Xylaria arbuscula]
MTRIRDSTASCNLCALVAHSVHDLPLDERQDDVTCHLYWEVDGRTAGREGSKVNCTRRLRIGWNDERLKPYEAHLILAAPAEYDKSDIDYPSRVDRNSQFLGRRIGSSASKRNLIREFLRLCERDHKGCSGNLGIEDPFAQTLREPYFGVIDIENQQLVPLRYHETIEGDRIESDPYATVSYVWGDRASHRHSTRKANVQHRLKPGGLAEVIECLPTALRHRDMVEGCVSDIRQWLENHTWIDWHIRDGHGTLRRIWGTSYEQDKSKEIQWRGYRGVATYDFPPALAENMEDDSNEDTDDEAERRHRRRYRREVHEIPPSSDEEHASRFRRRHGQGELRASLKTNTEDIQVTSSRGLQDQVPRDYFGRSHKTRERMVSFDSWFSLTLPEDPYHVCTTEENETPGLPDQPLLQFFTWRRRFRLVPTEPLPSPTDSFKARNGRNGGPRAPEPLVRCHIHHSSGDKCGSILVDREWLNKMRGRYTFEFIGISDAKSFTQEEFPDWTFYVPLERDECDWKLYFVLLVEYYEEEGIYRRVALGKVFQDAFLHQKDEWKEIILG